MKIQAWNTDMSKRWEYLVPKEPAQPRGSHMIPVLDINNDGVDEIMWGERCISIDSGKELFIADKEVYTGHSDIIQPVRNSKDSRWYIYACREKGEAPRVVMFDDGEKGFGAIWKKAIWIWAGLPIGVVTREISLYYPYRR